MKRKPKLIIILAVFITILAGTGLYINYRLNSLLDQTHLLSLGNESVTPEINAPISSQDENGSVKENENTTNTTGTKKSSYNNQTDPGKPENQSIVTKIETKAGQPIAKKDLLTAGLIIVRKLDKDEISYLKSLALKGSCSQEEYKRSQEILMNNLSDQDIETLKELGKKYGNNMNILTPN